MLAPCAVRDGEQIEHFYWTEWTFIFLIMKNRMQLRCKRFVSEQSCTLKISIDFLCRRNEWIFYHPWHVLSENKVHMTSPARICQLTVCLFFPPHFLPQHCPFVSSLFPWITLTTSYLVTVFLLSQTKTYNNNENSYFFYILLLFYYHSPLKKKTGPSIFANWQLVLTITTPNISWMAYWRHTYTIHTLWAGNTLSAPWPCENGTALRLTSSNPLANDIN